jgi:hypothetical protein
MASKRDWIAISDEVFVDPDMLGFYWIQWSPGCSAEEGFSNYPSGVSPHLSGYPSHYMRNKNEIAKELQIAWLPSYLKNG